MRTPTGYIQSEISTTFTNTHLDKSGRGSDQDQDDRTDIRSGQTEQDKKSENRSYRTEERSKKREN